MIKKNIIQENLLRECIQQILLEGTIPRSNPVTLSPASRGYIPIGMPGKNVAKAIGAFIALQWASRYVSPGCITSISSLGMPLPNASIEIKKIQAAAAIDAAAAAADIAGARIGLTNLYKDWTKALKKDLNGVTPGTTTYEKSGGLLGLFKIIETSASTTWPDGNPTLINLGAQTWLGSATQSTTPYGAVCQFVYDLMNAQCQEAVDNDKVQEIVKNELNTRAKFIDFVKTYNKTCYEDYTKIIEEHRQILNEKNITIDASTDALIKSVQRAYLDASTNIR